MTLIDTLPLFEFLGRFLGGPEMALVVVLALLKIGIVLAHILGIIPMIILAERKIIGYVQERPGPNRAGPWGILQGIVDGAKLLMKEDFIPAGADRTLYLIAPALVSIPAFLAMCIIPFGPVIEGQMLLDVYTLFGLQALWTPASQVPLAITNPNIGVLFVFAITSVGVYGITLAGWASENKWSLLGGIRASAQMISYELSLSLSIVGVLLIAGSLNLYDIIAGQTHIWQWNVFAQPVAFVIFVIAMFAETNRLPFDLAEGEAELTGGFHTEYSSMKFALFFLAEYINMITVAAVCATLFLGGFNTIPVEWVVAAITPVLDYLASTEMGFSYPESLPLLLAYLGAPLGLALKIGIFMYIFIVARATYPRLRYDQIMNLGWKILLVAGLVNLVITAFGIGILMWIGTSAAGAGANAAAIEGSIAWTIDNFKWTIGVVTFAGMVAADRAYRARRRRLFKAKYRNYLRPEAPVRRPAAA